MGPEYRPGSALSARNFGDLQPLARLEISLATKPVLHGRLQALEGYAIARLQQPVPGRQRVVEDGIVSEVAHGAVVDPSDRAGMSIPGRIDSFDREPARKHDLTLADVSRGSACGRNTGDGENTQLANRLFQIPDVQSKAAGDGFSLAKGGDELPAFGRRNQGLVVSREELGVVYLSGDIHHDFQSFIGIQRRSCALRLGRAPQQDGFRVDDRFGGFSGGGRAERDGRAKPVDGGWRGAVGVVDFGVRLEMPGRLAAGTFGLRQDTAATHGGERGADAVEIHRGPQIRERPPRVLLAAAVEIAPHDFEHLRFDFEKPAQSIGRANGGYGQDPVRAPEIGQVGGVKAATHIGDLAIVVGLEVGADIEQALFLKAENHGGGKIEVRRGYLFKPVNSFGVVGPDLDVVFEICVGGAIAGAAGHGAQEGGRALERVDPIFALRIPFGVSHLEGDDRRSESQVGAEKIDGDLGGLRGGLQFLRIPIEPGLACMDGEGAVLHWLNADGDSGEESGEVGTVAAVAGDVRRLGKARDGYGTEDCRQREEHTRAFAPKAFRERLREYHGARSRVGPANWLSQTEAIIPGKPGHLVRPRPTPELLIIRNFTKGDDSSPTIQERRHPERRSPRRPESKDLRAPYLNSNR